MPWKVMLVVLASRWVLWPFNSVFGIELKNSFLQRIPKRTDFLLVVGQMFPCQFGGFTHASNQRDVFRAAAQTTLLMSAVEVRRERRFAPNVKRANSFWRMKLVAG